MPTCDSSPSALRIAYILAGGKSSRFGSSKALVQIGGMPQILRLARQLQADSWQSVAISQTAGEFESLGIRTIGDIEKDCGPVAGVLSGLLDLRNTSQASHPQGSLVRPYALFVTCDLWEWNPCWSGMLIPPKTASQIEPGLLNYFQADSFLPFPCSIHVDALPQVQDAWTLGARSMRSLLKALENVSRTIVAAEGQIPASFNTHEDLSRLQG